MGNKIRVIVALVIIVGVAYWTFGDLRQLSYRGSDLSFAVGGGSVVVTNLEAEPIPVEMRTSAGRTSSFRITSAELGLNRVTSKREGSGSSAYQTTSFELPPGQARIDVVSGSGVHFVSTGGRIQAVVTPMSPGDVQMRLILAGLVILAALYYISRTLQHRWIGALRDGLRSRIRRSKPAST